MRRLTRPRDGVVSVDFDACSHLDFSSSLQDAHVVLLARQASPCWRLKRPIQPPLASKYVQVCALTGSILGAPLACTDAVYALCKKFSKQSHTVEVGAEFVDIDDPSMKGSK